jgi:hypothetical protein
MHTSSFLTIHVLQCTNNTCGGHIACEHTSSFLTILVHVLQCTEHRLTKIDVPVGFLGIPTVPPEFRQSSYSAARVPTVPPAAFDGADQRLRLLAIRSRTLTYGRTVRAPGAAGGRLTYVRTAKESYMQL